MSAINLDSIQAVRKDWLDSFIVRLTQARMAEVDRAIHFALDLPT